MYSVLFLQAFVFLPWFSSTAGFRLPSDESVPLDRKARQAIPLNLAGGLSGGVAGPLLTQTIDIGGQNLTLAGGLSGMSLESMSVESGQVFLDQNTTDFIVGQILLGDRKKRQAFPVSPSLNAGGQNFIVAGGFSGLSLEASLESGQIFVNNNGTLSLVNPFLTGQLPLTANQLPLTANGVPIFFGDRKKRQVSQLPFQPNTFSLPIQSISGLVQAQQAGLSVEDLSLEEPINSMLAGQLMNANNGAPILLGDRKKRQVFLPNAAFPFTRTINFGGQNITLAGGFSSFSLEASAESGQIFVNNNGTLSLVNPFLTGQLPLTTNQLPLTANGVPIFFGDRKKRQVSQLPFQPNIFSLPIQSINFGGQNITVAGGFSSFSLETSAESGQILVNNNGTLSFLNPFLTGQLPLTANGVPIFFGDRKKRQVSQLPFQPNIFSLPIQTINVGGQNITIAGGFSGLSAESFSAESGQIFTVDNNGTLSLRLLTGQALPLSLNNGGTVFLGDRKKRQAAGLPLNLPFVAPTIQLGGQNVTLLGSMSLASSEFWSAESGQLFALNNGTLSLLTPQFNGLLQQRLNALNSLTGQTLTPNSLSALLLGDRKKRQADTTPISPENLVLTAAAFSLQSWTAVDGGDGGDGEGDGTLTGGMMGTDNDEENAGTGEESMCICSSEMCASLNSFISVCLKMQTNAQCASAMDKLVILEECVD